MILFIIKLYARNNIFKHIKKKHGHDLIKVVRDFEQKKTKFKKLVADIAFIKLYKNNNLFQHSLKLMNLYEMAHTSLRQKFLA